MGTLFIPGITQLAVKSHFQSDEFLFQTKSFFFFSLFSLASRHCYPIQNTARSWA